MNAITQTMNRLGSTLRWEFVLQFRQGFFYAALFVIAMWSITLSQLPTVAAGWLLPFVLFIDVSIFGFFFMGGMLYLEKDDGVLEALVATPLRTNDYLLTKVISLTLLSIVVSAAIMAIATFLIGGLPVNWLMLLLGVTLNSWFLTMAGFILAVRFDSISDYILASVLFMIPFQIPLLDFFGVWENPLIYLIPTQPTMLLIEASLRSIPTWQVWYALGYLAIAIPLVMVWARRAFEQFVVKSAG